jgi:glycosyltransferase involved in cell wall biosynthesis
MARLPAISVVIPNLNCAALLVQTIQPVINQRYPHPEPIMVDGQSTGGWLDSIAHYRKHFAHAIVGPDTGQANALNQGFAVSTGEVMCWINSDDMLMPGGLHAAGAIFAQHDHVSWIVGNTTLIDEQDNIVRSSIPSRRIRGYGTVPAAP